MHALPENPQIQSDIQQEQNLSVSNGLYQLLSSVCVPSCTTLQLGNWKLELQVYRGVWGALGPPTPLPLLTDQ